MHFRIYSSVWGMLIKDGDELLVDFGGPHKVQVRVRQSTAEDQKRRFQEMETVCVCGCQFEPSAAIRLIFERLSQRLPPLDWKNTDPDNTYLDSAGKIKEGQLLPKESMPASFQEFDRQVDKELGEATVRAVGLLRWRCGMPGPHNPLRFRSMEWSIDGEVWSRMPGPMVWVEAGQIVAHWPLDARLGPELATLSERGITEPLGHELLREALHYRDSHKRSSLVIGIAAAEVGAKECISDLVPDAQWLVANVPSPPLINILRDYLPHLPARCKHNEQPVAVPETILEVFKKGVLLRNQVAHLGRKEPALATLEGILDAVQDVLWLFDYYRGFPWALNHIRPETRKAMSV